MRRTSWVLAGVAAAALVAAGGLAARRSGSAGPSTLSSSASGWSVARRYLEMRGCRATLLDAPLARARPEGAVVFAFPESVPRDGEDLEAVQRLVRRGADLLLAFSGDSPGPNEESAFRAFRMRSKPVRGDLPLAPAQWHRFRTAVWRLKPEAAPAPEVVIPAPRAIPVAPPGSQVFFRGEGGDPMIFAFRSSLGRVFVIPAEALSNGRLSEAGNGDLLESLRTALGSRLAFDEYHHGLSSAPAEAVASSSFPFDLLLGQLLLLYLLAVIALARRFGPAWEETAVRTGSTSSFLLGLASRHRRLGHFSRAAELLLARARALDPALHIPEDLDSANAGREESFLALAASVGRLQSSKGAAR